MMTVRKASRRFSIVRCKRRARGACSTSGGFISEYTHASFGTLLWPPSVDQARIMLDVLVQLGVIFILVHGQATVGHVEVAKGAVARSRGILIPWAKRHAILAHSVSRHTTLLTPGYRRVLNARREQLYP